MKISLAVDFRVRDAFAEVGPWRAQIARRVGFAERPERLARGRIDRDDLPALADDGVQQAVDEYRRRSCRVIDAGPEVVAAENPRDLEIGEIATR